MIRQWTSSTGLSVVTLHVGNCRPALLSATTRAPVTCACAGRIAERYRKQALCFNDDIQGTGAVSVAGILSALRQQGKAPSEIVNQKFVIAGAGSAGLGVANALVDAMVQEGKPFHEARAFDPACLRSPFLGISSAVVISP